MLETAAGSGVVTRSLAHRLASDARYVVSDLNEPMLDRAKARQGVDSRIEWQQADALKLPFEDRVFDAVVCQFGAMFFPDKVAGFAEARRVLSRGGRFVFNVWDRIERNEFADVVTEAAARVFPNDSPRFLARTPHGYYDIDVIRADMEVAGFAEVRIETVTEVSAASTPRHPAIAYCQGTPLRNEIEERDAARLEEVTECAQKAIAARFGDGPVKGTIQAHVITGVV